MTHRKGKGRRRAFLLLAALALLVLTACAAGRQRARYSQISDFNGAALGLTTGATMDNVLNRVLEDVTYHRYGDSASLLAALRKGEIDAAAFDRPAAVLAAGGFPITEERRAVVDFPAAHYACTIVLLCRAGDLGLDVPPQAPGGPFARLAQGLEKTLLREGRWKLIAQGLAVTLEITFCAALAGTALGFGLYLVRRSRCTPARRADAAPLQGGAGLDAQADLDGRLHLDPGPDQGGGHHPQPHLRRLFPAGGHRRRLLCRLLPHPAGRRAGGAAAGPPPPPAASPFWAGS